MKTLRTIATILLAAFMVLAPLAAVAAGETVTVATNANTYAGASVIQVTGTVSPAPASSNTAVVVTTKGPSGVVDTGPASVATGTGAYAYTFVAGGSTMWTTGTYTVNATYGGPGGTGSATSTFTYTASGPGGSGGPANYYMSVSIQGTYIPSTGAVVISVLTSSPTGTLDDVATWSPFHIHYPDGTLHNICTPATTSNCVGTFTRVHTGFYYVNFTLPATALVGLYSVHAGTTDANSVTGEGLGTFTVQPASSGGSGGATTTTTVTVTASGTGASPDAAALAAIQTQLSSMSSTLTAVQTTVNGISTGVSGITNTLSGLSTGLASVAGMPQQLTNLNNSVNNDQTYVLVVAALAAITLVLELAILVRKLS